jgi:hypothetical protein
MALAEDSTTALGGSRRIDARDEDVDDLAFLPALVLQRLLLVENATEVRYADSGLSGNL